MNKYWMEFVKPESMVSLSAINAYTFSNNRELMEQLLRKFSYISWVREGVCDRSYCVTVLPKNLLVLGLNVCHCVQHRLPILINTYLFLVYSVVTRTYFDVFMMVVNKSKTRSQRCQIICHSDSIPLACQQLRAWAL